jgi:hypothetical protein
MCHHLVVRIQEDTVEVPRAARRIAMSRNGPVNLDKQCGIIVSSGQLCPRAPTCGFKGGE